MHYQPVHGHDGSTAIRLADRCYELFREGTRVFDLSSDQSPFPIPSCLVDALGMHAGCREAAPVRGLEELRCAVAEYHRRRTGLTCTAEDVLVGPGAEDLVFLLRFAFDGELVVTSPHWPGFGRRTAVGDGEVTSLATRREYHWQITPEQLDELCRDEPGLRRIVALDSPVDPSGCVYTEGELGAITEAARRHGVTLISDEAYGELHFRGQHVSPATLYPEGTIVSGGLAKWCAAESWRLNVSVFPTELRPLLDTVASVVDAVRTAACTPVQYAAVQAYEGSIEIERYLWNVRRILRALGYRCYKTLQQAGIDVIEPRAAYFLFPRFSHLRDRLRRRGIATGSALCSRLLEEAGVALLPGCELGRPNDELTARISYANFDGAKALAASELLSKDVAVDTAFLRAYCGSTLEAIDRIVSWLRRSTA